ncbi:hypothetical protein [Pseudalkalibacillus hwajinpoensis]|uniref:Lipoprotein n=1 Tax=Guptibacillus hwajinpoensis TaxID=208199 RepID=A0A4U1MJN2_9BACL|nr:hypothetical protein [Pseudalkalibacillus hwajinpoensis]TKD70804.1 hypothetical protein FBF83_09330 [Pseudalkalibacillus hwajinpoensis]
MRGKWLLAGFMALLALVGCSDSVQDDLLHYVNDEMPALAEEETEIINLYDSVIGPNHQDDSITHQTLITEVIPQYVGYIDRVQKVKVETSELRELHENYIDALHLQHSAFLGVVSAIEHQDYGEMDAANAKLQEAGKMMRDYQEDVNVLAEEHGVELTK